MLILVTGGCRSGKSGYALELAQGLEGPRTFIATAQAFDEMRCGTASSGTREAVRPSGG